MSAKNFSSHLHRSASFHQPSPSSLQKHNPLISPYISSTVPKNLQLQVFVDSATRKHRDTVLCGYGVFVPLHSIRIAEPLPGSAQTPERAEIRALHAALELIHGIRARRAVILIPSTFVVDIFNNRLSRWEANAWKTTSTRYERNRRLWKDIALLRNVFADRGVHLEVKVKAKRHGSDMKVAYRLAKHGASLHITCKLCRNTHGRQFLNHRCQPVCFLDQCNGRVMRDTEMYTRHLYDKHRRVCERDDCDMKFECFTQQEMDEHVKEAHGTRTYACDFCGKTYSQRKKMRRHMKSRCRAAPHCEDCGKRLTSRREMERHNARGRSEVESSSSDEESDDRYEDERGRFPRSGMVFGGEFDGGADLSDSDVSGSSSEDSEEEGGNQGLFLTDKRGRQWEIDEYGLRRRRGETVADGFLSN